MSTTTSTPKEEAKPAFEAALEQLQTTVKRLESGELSLEQSLSQFEEGVKLTRLCQEQLSAAERRVEILMNAKPELQPFNPNQKG
jgi:exodeoxyribonuclease VII small subunit